MTSAATTLPATDRQPRGIVVLATTQFWEAFSLYGVQSMLVLFMADQLLLPGNRERVLGLAGVQGAIESLTGPLSPQALAVQIFGLYAGLLRFTPVLGGWVGDRLFGRRRTVATGAVLMTLGHLCMAFDQTFLVALLLLILGVGGMNANLMAQVSALYGPTDRRRDDGFQLYYMGLNTGAFLAPVVCGWLGQEYSWHLGFGVAGVGMLGALIIYLAGTRHLPPDGPRLAAAGRAPLTAPQRRVVAFLCLIVPVTALFWISQAQVWNVYNLWVRDHVELAIAGWRVPVPWFQALDSLAPLIMAPVLIAVWRWQARRGQEPGDVMKLVIGCLLMAGSMAWLALAGPLFGARVPLLWAVAFHFILNLGWLFFVPVMLAVYGRLGPPSLNAMLMGVNSLAVFLASTIGGRIGALYEVLSPAEFWLLHAGITLVGAAIFFGLRPVVARLEAENPGQG
jgi:POT family proton-dependent oligopeptide transporter